MHRDLAQLDEHLVATSTDGYLVYADGDHPTQRYLTDFFAPDPFVTLYSDGDVRILVNPGEYEQAMAESRADVVTSLGDYDIMRRFQEHGRYEAFMLALAEYLEDNDLSSVAVPTDFPASVADRLRNDGVTVVPESADLTLGGVMADVRATKSDAEIEHLQRTQSANEAAMATVERIIAESVVEDNCLHYDGTVLTVERLKTELEMELLRQGCILQETILACGSDAAEPHNLGSGPIRPDETIVVDIFPQDKESKYFGDMTRTFLKGTPSEAIREFYDLTLEAQAAAFDEIEAGISGKAVYEAACEVFESSGYATLRNSDAPESGFITFLGHGVGLSVHEPPFLGPNAGELKPGHVVTVEPGLYDPDIGGVRIEDLVVVTEDGYENLNDYPKELVIE